MSVLDNLRVFRDRFLVTFDRQGSDRLFIWCQCALPLHSLLEQIPHLPKSFTQKKNP